MDIPMDNVYVTIWSRQTLLERARNLHCGVTDMCDWVSDSGHFPIYGKEPSKPDSIIIGGVVLFYISGETPNRIAGAGKIKCHYQMATVQKIYEKEEHNQYCVVLERVVFFDKQTDESGNDIYPYTSKNPVMNYNTKNFINGVSRGENVIQRICAKPPGDDYRTLCDNVLRDMCEKYPSFSDLFLDSGYIIHRDNSIKTEYKERTNAWKSARLEYTKHPRWDERNITLTPDGKEFLAWGKLMNNTSDIMDTSKIGVSGVYEIGFVTGGGVGNVISNEDVNVVYVGKSKDIYKRIKQHSNLNKNVVLNDIKRNGHTLVWRYVKLDNEYEADYVEQQLLFLYNYLVNKKDNN